jgi:hypothetical protein
MEQHDAELKNLIDLLYRTEKDFLGALEGVSAQQCAFRTATGRWTIEEIAEHIVLVEELLQELLTSAAVSTEEPNRGFDEKIHRHAPSRARVVEAPERVRPRGRFANMAESAANFRQIRCKTHQIVQETSTKLRQSRVNHPVAGVIDSYQCLLLLAYHPQRHIGQLDEIKAHADYPR